MYFHSIMADHLLLMTSYRITIVTDHHWTCLKMRARDKITASEKFRCWCFIVLEKSQKYLMEGWQPPTIPSPPSLVRPSVNSQSGKPFHIYWCLQIVIKFLFSVKIEQYFFSTVMNTSNQSLLMSGTMDFFLLNFLFKQGKTKQNKNLVYFYKHGD